MSNFPPFVSLDKFNSNVGTNTKPETNNKINRNKENKNNTKIKIP